MLGIVYDILTSRAQRARGIFQNQKTEELDACKKEYGTKEHMNLKKEKLSSSLND